jgi:hypothetical protein
MSKIGVNVGEDFPVDEGAPPNTSEPEGCRGNRAEAFRQWHARKHQWHQKRAEWRARKRAMREQFREEFGRGGHFRGQRAGHLALGVLALVGLAALLGFAHHDR